jgi:Ferritin-like
MRDTIAPYRVFPESETETKVAAVTTESRDLEWIKANLQTAIALEHATLPLYLSSMFSLKIQNFTAYNALRSVAMEEMVHMSIACNMLAALGGSPQIKNLDPGFPTVGLPGGVEPDLALRPAKLSPAQLQTFMRVEVPAFLLPPEHQAESYPTIADLYSSIDSAIDDNADAVRAAMKEVASSQQHANQVGDDIGFTTITYVDGEDPLPQLHAGIHEIIEQGEGSPTRTLHADAASEGEASHYCKFAELYYGQTYQTPTPDVELTPETEPQFFRGYPVPFPEVANVLALPKDGYAAILAEDPDTAVVSKALAGFDTAYTAMLTALDAVWNGPAATAWPTLGDAVKGMGGLRVPACFQIIPHQIPPDVVAKLPTLYPDEHEALAGLTDLDQPVFYGPRFFNLNTAAQAA